ncbi:MAG: NADH-quinone oxidoreductase subunit A [Planctomycetota bacterium]
MDAAEALRLLGALALAFGVPALAMTVLRRLVPRRSDEAKQAAFEGGSPPLEDARRRIPTRLRSAALVSAVLVAVALVFLPLLAASARLGLGARVRFAVLVILVAVVATVQIRRRGVHPWP